MLAPVDEPAIVLSGGERPGPPVIRRGSVVHRPTGSGSELMAALLVHLEEVGFDQAPRFLGVDDGHHMVSFVEGETFANPPWQEDDAANAKALGELARLLRLLHEATAGFAPPPGLEPLRPLPLPGTTWTHGDVGYANVVYRSGEPVALIDWEFAAPGAPIADPAALLAVSTRGPKPHVDDNDRRAAALHRAAEAIVAGHGIDDLAALYRSASVVLDDAADYWEQLGSNPSNVEVARWRSQWLHEHVRGA